MPISQFFTRTIQFLIVAIGIEGAAFFYDLFFHIRPTNPVWDANYNWWPVITATFVAALLVSAIRIVGESHQASLIYRLPHRGLGDRRVQA
jgi:hypothetical protein